MARGRLSSTAITSESAALVYSNESGQEASITIRGESLGGSSTTSVGISTINISPLNSTTFFSCMDNVYIRYSKSATNFLIDGLVISNNDKVYVYNSGTTVSVHVYGYEG